MRRRIVLLVVAVLWLSLMPRASSAQEWLPFESSPEEEYENAFRTLLANPADETALGRYANAATRVGNLEAAIATLERILALKPDLDSVRVELGVLYGRIHADEIARAQLERALASPKLSPAARARAEAFLRGIALQESFGLLTGFVSIGGRYQTNANQATSSAVLREAGFDFPIPAGEREKDDFNGFFLGAASHIYDLGTASWETRGATYWTRQAKVDEADIGLLEISSGPRLPVLPSMVRALTVRPFGVGGFSLLRDKLNDYELGGGAEIEKRIGLHSAAALSYTGRQRTFQTETDRTGFTHRVDGVLSLSWTSDFSSALGAYYVDQQARQDFRANWQASVWGRTTFRYVAPFGITDWPWLISGQVRWTTTHYRGPDDRVDPFVTRRDNEVDLIGRHTFGLTSTLGLFVEAEYTHSTSNLSTGEFDNTAVALGTTWSF